MMAYKVMRAAVFCVVAAVLVAACWTAYRQHRLRLIFQNMQPGTAESDARRELGKPWKIASCGETFGGQFPASCRTEYIYASPYAPVIPHYWAFFFDANGRLIDKYEYQSP